METLWQLEANIDDMNPQFYESLSERLFAAGAFDVWLTPVTMKKGRPAIIVSAIVPANRRDEVERVLFTESTTLGVRAMPSARTKAARHAYMAFIRLRYSGSVTDMSSSSPRQAAESCRGAMPAQLHSAGGRRV